METLGFELSVGHPGTNIKKLVRYAIQKCVMRPDMRYGFKAIVFLSNAKVVSALGFKI